MLRTTARQLLASCRTALRYSRSQSQSIQSAQVTKLSAQLCRIRSNPAAFTVRQHHRSMRIAAVSMATAPRLASKRHPIAVLQASPVSLLLLWLPAGLVVLAVVAVTALPALLGTDFGKDAVVGFLNSRLPVTVSADSVQLSWTGPTTLSGLRAAAADLSDKPPLSARSVRIDGGMMALLPGRQANVVISGLSIDGMLDEGGDFKVLQLFHSDRKVQRRRRPLPPDSSLRRSVRVGFSADAKLPGFDVTVQDSSVLLPDPYREIAGGSIHASANLGSQHVSTDDWGGNPPEGATEPCTLAVTGPNAELNAAGWRCSDGTWRLRQPADAGVAYSPALAEYGLALLNPLLSDAVTLRQGGRVQLSFAPAGLRYPMETTTVRVAPLRLGIGRSPLLRQLLAVLTVADRALSRMDALEVWTAPLVAEVDEAGPVRTQRTDLLLCGQGSTAGLHLILWGSVDSTVGGAVDVTLGLPADTLRRLGLEIPGDQVLPIHIGGTSDSYQVDWTTASSKLATLVARQRTGSGDEAPDLTSISGFAKEVLKRALKEADRAQVITQPAPPLLEPLPWAAGE